MGQNVDMRAAHFPSRTGRLYPSVMVAPHSNMTRTISTITTSMKSVSSHRSVAERLRYPSSGSADGNQQAAPLQKAISRMQMFSGNPLVNQAELTALSLRLMILNSSVDCS